MKSKQKEMDVFSMIVNVNQLVFLINLQHVMGPVFINLFIIFITVCNKDNEYPGKNQCTHFCTTQYKLQMPNKMKNKSECNTLLYSSGFF